MSLNEILNDAKYVEASKKQRYVFLLMATVFLGVLFLLSEKSEPQKREFTGPPKDDVRSLPRENNEFGSDYTTIDSKDASEYFSEDNIKNLIESSNEF